MIIIGQNKKYIVNFQKAKGICLGELKDNSRTQVVIRFEKEDLILGEYETLERAQEILEEIAGEYTNYISLENIVGGVQSVCATPNAYYMPEE